MNACIESLPSPLSIPYYCVARNCAGGWKKQNILICVLSRVNAGTHLDLQISMEKWLDFSSRSSDDILGTESRSNYKIASGWPVYGCSSVRQHRRLGSRLPSIASPCMLGRWYLKPSTVGQAGGTPSRGAGLLWYTVNRSNGRTAGRTSWWKLQWSWLSDYQQTAVSPLVKDGVQEQITHASIVSQYLGIV